MAYKIQLGDMTSAGEQSYTGDITVQDKLLSGSQAVVTGDLTINADGTAQALEMGASSQAKSYAYNISNNVISLDGDGVGAAAMNRIRLKKAGAANYGVTMTANASDQPLLTLQKGDASLPISVNNGALSAQQMSLGGNLIVNGNMTMGASTQLIIQTTGNDTIISGSFVVSDKLVEIGKGHASNGTGVRLNWGKLGSTGQGASLKYDHAHSNAGSAPAWDALDGNATNRMPMSASFWAGDGSSLSGLPLTLPLAVDGAGGSPITADATLSQGGIYFVDVSSADVELTLPASSAGMEGRLFRFKVVGHAAGRKLSITAPGSDKIDGTALTTLDITSQHASIDLVQGKHNDRISSAAIYHIF